MYKSIINWFKVNLVFKNKKISIIMFYCFTIYIMFVGYLYWKLTYTPSYKFDKSEWFGKINKRYRYGKNIDESKMLIGLDTFEIKNLIGVPTISFNNLWDYNLGTSTEGTGFGFGFNNLRLKFKNNKVDSVFFSTYID